MFTVSWTILFVQKGKAGIKSSGTKSESMLKIMKQDVAKLGFNNMSCFFSSRTSFMKVTIATKNMNNYSNRNMMREYFVQ